MKKITIVDNATNQKRDLNVYRATRNHLHKISPLLGRTFWVLKASVKKIPNLTQNLNLTNAQIKCHFLSCRKCCLKCLLLI